MSVTVTAFATVTASARSMLGPLLTTFTPPSACQSYGGPSTNLESGYQEQNCSDAIVVDDASCWPTASVSAPSPRLNGWGFYSPGTVCPSGYAVSCGAGFIESSVNTDSGTTSVPPNFDFQFPLAAGETAVGCCPEYAARTQKRAMAVLLTPIACQGLLLLQVYRFQVPNLYLERHLRHLLIRLLRHYIGKRTAHELPTRRYSIGRHY